MKKFLVLLLVGLLLFSCKGKEEQFIENSTTYFDETTTIRENETTEITLENDIYENSETEDIETEEESKDVKEIELTAENYPIVDGSTANMPLMAMIRSDVLKEDLTVSQNKTEVTTTDYAWRNLLAGDADLLLVYD